MTWLLLAVVAALLIWLLLSYKGLVGLRARAAQAFGVVDVQLKQRHDLVPSLVETVRLHTGQERATLEEVVQASNAALSAQGANQQAASEGVLQSALGRLIAVGETYPALQADTDFRTLKAELSDIENELAVARRSFNNAVAAYNAAIVAIPAVLFAKPAGFRPKAFFDVGETKHVALDTPPSVKF